MLDKNKVPEQYQLYCEICKVSYDARDLAQALPHLKHNPNFPQDFQMPDHYTTRIDGEAKEFLDGKEEVDIN